MKEVRPHTSIPQVTVHIENVMGNEHSQHSLFACAFITGSLPVYSTTQHERFLRIGDSSYYRHPCVFLIKVIDPDLATLMFTFPCHICCIVATSFSCFPVSA